MGVTSLTAITMEFWVTILCLAAGNAGFFDMLERRSRVCAGNDSLGWFLVATFGDLVPGRFPIPFYGQGLGPAVSGRDGRAGLGPVDACYLIFESHCESDFTQDTPRRAMWFCHAWA